jgi:hypothetical protein
MVVESALHVLPFLQRGNFFDESLLLELWRWP